MPKLITIFLISFSLLCFNNSQLYSNITGISEAATDTAKSDTIKPWKIGGVGNLSFAQGYLSGWVNGGESSISTMSDLNLFANYSRNKSNWDNLFVFKYGIMKLERLELRKNEDLIDISSKYGFYAFKYWYYSFMASFKSQFDKGFEYPNDSVPISDFMAPAYILFSLGMDFKPHDKLSVLMSLLTSKYTIVSDTARIEQTKYGIEANQKTRKEFGAYLKADYKLDITKEILLNTKLNLFTNYLKNPKNIDVDCELILAMKVNKYITTNISAHLIYDDDVDVPVYKYVNDTKIKVGTGKRIQFKELLSVGFSYKF